MKVINSYCIDKDIPPPNYRNFSYPFKYLEIGDSFFVYGKTPRNLGTSLNYARKTLGISLISRKVPNGTRIWRVKDSPILIEKNVPQPIGGIYKRMAAMKLNESLIIEGHTSRTIGGYVTHIKEDKEYRFKTRTTNKGVRVTRIE